MNRARICIISVLILMVLMAGVVWANDMDIPSLREPIPLREIKERRTDSTKTFLNDDGSLTTEIYMHPIHYKDKHDIWREIDLRLLPIETLNDTWKTSSLKAEGFTHSAACNSIQVFLGPTSASPKRVGVEDVWVELIPCDARNIEGSIGLEKAKYKGIWFDADLEYIIEPDRLKEQIILYSQAGARCYSFQLRTSGLEPRQDEDGTIGLYLLGTDERKLFIPPSFMYDSAPKPAYSNKVETILRKENDTWYVDIIPDEGWLCHQTRVYPVIIDPIITRSISPTIADTYISFNSYENGYYENYGTLSYLYVYERYEEYYDDYDEEYYTEYWSEDALLRWDITSGLTP